MITMVDEIFDREYQAGRSDLNTGIGSLIGRLRDAIAPAFIAMHRIEWDAPWSPSPERKTQG